MEIGIQICGLNGSGKSTLAKALAESMGIHFIDNENLYFPRTAAGEPYEKPRSRREVEKLLMEEIREHGSFVFAAVKGDYGAEVMSLYNYVVVIEVPREIRLQRVRNRSFRRFGKRMLPGGDLYETEEAFFRMVEAREEDYVGKWLNVLQCPVIRVDGTRPVGENVERVMKMIQSEQ